MMYQAGKRASAALDQQHRTARGITLTIGSRFGKWTIIDDTPPGYLCRCDCGVTKRQETGSLTSGRSSQCRACSYAGPFNTKKNKQYSAWRNMLSRCENPINTAYKYYGGRGIRICQRWHDWKNFYIDTGDRPKNRSLDRKDNDGNYSCGKCPECIANGWPANWRWATYKQQARNTRKRTKTEVT